LPDLGRELLSPACRFHHPDTQTCQRRSSRRSKGLRVNIRVGRSLVQLVSPWPAASLKGSRPSTIATSSHDQPLEFVETFCLHISALDPLFPRKSHDLTHLPHLDCLDVANYAFYVSDADRVHIILIGPSITSIISNALLWARLTNEYLGMSLSLAIVIVRE
jgi:hypothetical protein